MTNLCANATNSNAQATNLTAKPMNSIANGRILLQKQQTLLQMGEVNCKICKVVTSFSYSDRRYTCKIIPWIIEA